MPPRAISPRSWSRAAGSAGAGISGEPGLTIGPGSVPGSVSRSKTRGTGPTLAARLVNTLAPPEPDASDIVADGAAVGRAEGFAVESLLEQAAWA